MPELPEVETVRRGLEPVLTGRRIAAADVRRPDLRWPFPKGLAQRLDRGGGSTALRRRSKYLLADLDRGETLIVHLGMSGRLLVSGAQVGAVPPSAPGAGEARPRRPRPRGRRARHLQRRPALRGGRPLADRAMLEHHRLLAGLGPEPLGNGFDGGVSGRRGWPGGTTPVKAVLLDQRVVAGLGNIYVCEALWRARDLAAAAGRAR